jgi:hypothetical protein
VRTVVSELVTNNPVGGSSVISVLYRVAAQITRYESALALLELGTPLEDLQVAGLW